MPKNAPHVLRQATNNHHFKKKIMYHMQLIYTRLSRHTIAINKNLKTSFQFFKEHRLELKLILNSEINNLNRITSLLKIMAYSVLMKYNLLSSKYSILPSVENEGFDSCTDRNLGLYSCDYINLSFS